MPKGRGTWWASAVVAATVIGTAAIRLRTLDVPLDRDEGEYAYIGQLLLQGVPPYAHAYNMKMPGIYGLYAAILALFGQTPAGIHLGLMLANAVAIVLVFLAARHAFDRAVAAAAAFTFAVLSMSTAVLGLAAYAEQFVVIPVLAGTLVLWRALERQSSLGLVVSGVLFGAAFVIKQSGGAFLGFAVVSVLADAARSAPGEGEPRWEPRRAAVRVGALVGGALLPLLGVCVTLLVAGTFPTFWFWTARYAGEYVRATPVEEGLAHLLTGSTDILRSSWPTAAAAALGLSALFWDDAFRRRRRLVVAFLAFSLLAVAPGLYFRPQYFILLLPALALLAGLAPVAVARRFGDRHRRAVLVLGLALAMIPPLVTLYRDRRVLLQSTPITVSRRVYGLNPFPESVEIANYIRQRTAPAEPIVVLGSEPQIYFYAHRRAATGYIYMYPAVESHRYASAMQRQIIREIEAASPAFVVLVRASASWRTSADADVTLLTWFENYVRNFERVGVVDILSSQVTRYVWDEAAVHYSPRSTVWLEVYRRKVPALDASLK
jgi:dolichyl-phosphate-mannose-protein mannosyltransferase